jgi:hypothetical protein
MASLVYEEMSTGNRIPRTLATTSSTATSMENLFMKHLRIVSETADTYDNSFMEENSRIQALDMARKIVARLETPEEVVLRYAWEVCLSFTYQSLQCNNLSLNNI